MMPERSHQDVTQLIAAVLAVHGGLNERAKRAILEIARSQGYGAREILSILEQVARHDHDATILAVTHAAEKSDPHDDHAHRNRMGVYFRANRAARITLAILTSSLFIASVILLVLSALTIRGMLPVASVDEARIVPPPRERAPQPGPLVNGQALQTQDVQDGSPPDASLYDVLLSPFDEAQDRFREIGGDALIPVAASIDHISQIWASLDRVSIEASSNRIANLLLVLEQGPSDHASRLLELVLIPSSHIRAGEPAHGRVLPAVWSVGIAMRLTKETYTDPVIRTQLEAHILKIFPPGDRPRQPSFRAGATAAVELLARGAIDTASKPFASTDTQIWNDLRRALLALAELKEQPTRDAVLRLIGYTLLTGPSSANSSATAETLATLIQLIDWSTRESGQALLGWFDDPELPTQSLSPFLRHLENEPTFPDISETQPLTPASPPIQRAHIRDQIANVYSLPQSPTDGWVKHKWTPALHHALSAGVGGVGGGGGGQRDFVSALGLAVTASRLSSSASLRWNGSFAEADDVLTAAFDAEDEARTSILNSAVPDGDISSLTSPAGGSDGRFALAYINAKRNTGLRIDALEALDSSSAELGAADADVLVASAFYAVPIEVRTAAQRIALMHTSSLVMTHALLEGLPGAPRIELTRKFLERSLARDLPSPTSPEWTMTIRKHLLAKLHTQISAQRAPLIDELRARLIAATELRATARSSAETRTASRSEYDQLLELTSHYRGALLSKHAPERVALRHGRRAAIADGSIQQFVADRLSAVELFAYAVVSERPSNENRVNALMEQLEHDRNSAVHVFEQIAHIERAGLKLWAVRLATDLEAREPAS